MKPPPFLLIDRVSVETFRGQTSVGTRFDGSQEVRCSVEWRRRIIATSTGQEIVSEATLWADADQADKLTLQSRVTVDAKVMRVIEVRTHRGLTGPEQVEAVLA